MVVSEQDLFDQLAGAEAPAEPSFEDLPVQAWVLGKTANADNGGAAPAVRKFVAKKDQSDFYQFKVGLICVGGESTKISTAHKGRMAFWQAPITPWENDKGPISGKLAAFMNACCATGAGADLKDDAARSKARWGITMSILKGFAATNPMLDGEEVTLASYGGDVGRYLTGLFRAWLLENQCEVLFKTQLNKNKETGEVYGVQAGQIEEATAVTITKRKIARVDDEGMTY